MLTGQKSIKPLLVASLNRSASDQRRVQRRIREILGEDTVEEVADPKEAMARDLALSYLGDKMASRFQADDRSKPLLAGEDIAEALAVVIAGLSSEEDIPEEEIAEVIAFIQSLFVSVIRQLEVGPEEQYAQLWKIIKAIVQIAAERRVSPEVFIEQEDAWDEVNRRTTTLEESRAKSAEVFQKLFSDESVRKVYLQPIFDIAAAEGRAFDESEMDEMVEEMRESLERVRRSMLQVQAEEEARIWRTR